MLALPPSIRIYLATEPCDMRKGFDSLSMLVQSYGLDVFSGDLFVFLSKRRNRAKILMWSEGGFVLYYKRLERGRFKVPTPKDETETISLESSQLVMLLDGIDFSRIPRPHRWKPHSRKK